MTFTKPDGTTLHYTYDSEHRRITRNRTPYFWDGQHELGNLQTYHPSLKPSPPSVKAQQSSPGGFSSKRHDPESNLIYFGRRYYDPILGRFITSDPEGYTDSSNLYAYTLNNPLSHFDPYGLLTINARQNHIPSPNPSSLVLQQLKVIARALFLSKKFKILLEKIYTTHEN